jgi:hypothetical protein
MTALRNTVEEASEAFTNLFPVLLTTYLLILLIDTIWDGRISGFYDSRFLLLGVMLTGIVSVFKNREIEVNKQTITRNDYVFIAVLSIAGSVIVWYKLQKLGIITYIISIFTGLLIFLLSIIILSEDNETEE